MPRDPLLAHIAAAHERALHARLAVQRLIAAGMADAGFAGELAVRCEAFAASMDDLAKRAAEHLHATREHRPARVTCDDARP